MYSSLVLWLHGDFESSFQYDGCVCVCVCVCVCAVIQCNFLCAQSSAIQTSAFHYKGTPLQLSKQTEM